MQPFHMAEDDTLSPAPNDHSTAMADGDQVALLSLQQVPSIHISPAQESRQRGHRCSRDVTDAELQPFHVEASDVGAVQTSYPKARGSSPKLSGASNLLRRLTMMRTSMKRTMTSRRAGGAAYGELDGDGGDHVPVDLSSLAGMGYELTHLPAILIYLYA